MLPSGSGSQLPSARRAHKKSKTGCQSCRIRKVKCDERRPLCQNCQRHFIGLVACDFDGRPPLLATNASVTQNPTAGRQAEPLQLPQAPAAGRIDPFEARPWSQTPAPSVDELMNHYLNDFAYRSFPFYASRPLIETWWPFVRSDQLLFHVTLLLSSLDQARLQANGSVHALRLLDQTVSLLRERVSDPVASVSDQTMVSMALLAAMEHDRENMRAMGMHMDGLRRVLSLRGGLSAIRRINPMAANMIFWCAMISIGEPSLLPLGLRDGDLQPELPQDTPDLTLLTHDESETNLADFGVDPLTAEVLHEVQRLSKLYTSTLASSTPQEAMHVLNQLCLILQRLMFISRAPSDVSNVPGLSQSCRIAGCLHIFAPLSAYFPAPTLMLQAFVADIRTSLAHMIAATGTRSHLLLWLLAVGGITAHAMPERAWFVGYLVVVVSDLGIATWEDMRGHLVKLAFHDNFCDISFRTLWEQVRQKQLELNVGAA